MQIWGGEIVTFIVWQKVCRDRMLLPTWNVFNLWTLKRGCYRRDQDIGDRFLAVVFVLSFVSRLLKWSTIRCPVAVNTVIVFIFIGYYSSE